MSIRATIAALIALCCAGITAQSGQTGIPPEFRAFYDPILENPAAALAALPCERISLQLEGGMLFNPTAGSSPLDHTRTGMPFRLTLLRAGRAEFRAFNGEEFVSDLEPHYYGKLCHLVVGFQSARYAARLSDMSTSTIEIGTRSGVTTVADYGGAAPAGVWAAELAIRTILYSESWKKK